MNQTISDLTRADLEVFLKARKADLIEIENASNKMNRAQAYLLQNDIQELQRIIGVLEEELSFRKQSGESLTNSYLDVEKVRATQYITCPYCTSRNRIITFYYNNSAKCWNCGEVYEERESI